MGIGGGIGIATRLLGRLRPLGLFARWLIGLLAGLRPLGLFARWLIGLLAGLLVRARALLGEPARRRRLALLRAGQLPWRRRWWPSRHGSQLSRPHWKPTPPRWSPTPPLDQDDEAAWREAAGDHRAAAIERAALEIELEYGTADWRNEDHD